MFAIPAQTSMLRPSISYMVLHLWQQHIV